MRILIVVVALFCSCASTAAAVDMTVFGFELGARLVLPECKISSVYSSSDLHNYKLYAKKQKTTCIDEERFPKNGAYGTRFVQFSEADAPQNAKDTMISAFCDSNGVLLGVGIFTFGIQNQQFDLAQLTAKYGKPTKVNYSSAQNGFGARYDVLHARWDLDGLTVVFNGSLGLLDQGSIEIDTSRAVAAKAAMNNKIKPSGKSL